MRDWSGHLLVLGLAASGMAVAEWALARADHGVSVTVVDSGSGEQIEDRAAELRSRGATVITGTDEVPAADLVVASPGIRPSSALIGSARALGVPIISEIELAYRVSRCPWVAITGTNGKTTTTALVAHLLAEAGFAAEPAGNFGPPAVRVATEMGQAGIIVAEVSSFQLSHTDTFHPRIAALLNITPDHIDYHGSLEAYTAEKLKVFARQVPGDVAVVDIDDAGSAVHVGPLEDAGITVRRVSRQASPAGGAYLRDGMLVLDENGLILELVHADELLIKGDHNVSNALAAAACARAAGADVESLRRGLRSFRPIEHRLEPSGTVNGVEYFNDSKATNPDAVMKALTAFGERSLVLLLGGRNKGVDLRPLARAVADRAVAVVLFGEAAAEFEAAFGSLPVRRAAAADMAGAIEMAHGLARPGDVVVLSPGCTSFDEFSGYEARGRRFKEIVSAMEAS